VNRTLTSIIALALAGGGIAIASSGPDAECTPGTQFMVVVDAHVPATDEAPARCLRVPVVTECGDPPSLAWTIDSEAREIPCGTLAEGEVRRVPVAEAFPESVVGEVERVAVGDEPAVAPYVGVCQGPGCRCASERCEALPIGGPNSTADSPPYFVRRLCRVTPEAPECP